MSRTGARAKPAQEQVLRPLRRHCPGCGGVMRIRYENRRTLVRLDGAVGLRLKVRRCEVAGCTYRLHVFRPEAEGALALPQHEFGLDVIALVGLLRYRDHRSVPEIHAQLRARGLAIAERTVTNLLDRYDELVATSVTDREELRGRLAAQGRIILGLDGLQPDVGHEVLWVLRDCLSGTVLVARSLLSATAEDLVPLLAEVVALGVPVEGVISDGQAASAELRMDLRHRAVVAMTKKAHQRDHVETELVLGQRQRAFGFRTENMRAVDAARHLAAPNLEPQPNRAVQPHQRAPVLVADAHHPATARTVST